MKQYAPLRSKPTPETDYEKVDIDRIYQLLLDKGYRASRKDIAEAWRQYSAYYAAGWLSLPENDYELFNTIMEYLEYEV